jgi:precorrin-2 dehydrogenase/sirohydrochlorin ferrochelatase
MGYLVNLTVEGREALVVGGGEIAARKVEDLLAAKARVTVVAPRIGEKIAALADRVPIHRRPYESGDIGDSFVVIAATDDEDLNAQVSRDCAARHVLVNVVDRPALCTFTVPATVHRGDLTIAISTDGRCPAFASILREELEGRYGPEYGELVELFAQLRKQMTARGWGGPKIRERLASIYKDGVIELIGAGDEQRLRDLLIRFY